MGDVSDALVAHSFVVHGTVQGVGYRYFTCATARKLGVTGWVSNHIDGSVAGVVRGEAGSVEEFLRAIGIGPAGARVERVQLAQAVLAEIPDRGFVVR